MSGPDVGCGMRRREFVSLFGGAVAAWPLAAHGQSDKISRIGFIGASPQQAFMAAQYASFLAELREQGFEEGRNIVVDYKRIDDPHGPFAAAAELMRSQADLIVATGPEAAPAGSHWCKPQHSDRFSSGAIRSDCAGLREKSGSSRWQRNRNFLSTTRTGRKGARYSGSNLSRKIAISCSL
jgi:hypothetical protein